jgi:leucyl aminopeptidase
MLLLYKILFSGANMKFDLNTKDIAKQKSDCLIIGLFENAVLTPAAEALNKTSRGQLRKLIKASEFQGNIGNTLFLYDISHLNAACVLLVGCGKNNPQTAHNYRKIISSSIKALTTTKITHAITCLTELEVEKQALPWKIKQATEVTVNNLYQFDQFKTKKQPYSLKSMTLHVPEVKKLTPCQKALKQAIGITDGMILTKNLANLPSNICTPAYLAEQAKLLAKQYKSIKVKILEEKDMKKLGMGAILAVSKGSAHGAKLVCLEYQGTSKKQAPIAFVGKGITFDTGGLSLKPADSMVGMKYDMCGAATVLGVLKSAAELKLPLNLVGILAVAENMPGGTATKPEDIVTTLSGQTVEIMNTDAEGRLVLCDALTYCERYKPETVIDIATLTGAVVIALGYHASGLLSNHEPLAKELLEAGIESHDRAWQLPLWEEYQEQLKSPFADMSNVGGRAAGVITSSCFLSRFTKKFHWAHLDVAGTAAMMGGNDRYATGRPVPLLVQFLISRTGDYSR